MSAPTGSRSVRRAAAAVVLALAVTACGSGGDDTEASTDAPGTETSAAADQPSDGTDAGVGAAEACPPTQLTFTNSETGTSGTATDAVATADYPGSPYLAYAADHEIDGSAVSGFYPTVGADDNVVLVQFTTLTGDPAPYEPGMELVWGEPGPTFLVIHVEGDQRFQTAVEVETSGTLSLTEVSSDALCFEIDYRDGTVEVAGTVAAPIVTR